MAHMARAAGTDYAVAGGKTLIDGTAYSVVATREVEKTIVLEGRSTEGTGNKGYGSGTIGVLDERLDWTKYNLKLLCFRKDLSVTDGNTRSFSFCVSDNENIFFCGLTAGFANYYGASFQGTVTVDTSVNGKLSITIPNNWSAEFYVGPFYYEIVLEAKT